MKNKANILNDIHNNKKDSIKENSLIIKDKRTKILDI